MKKQTLLTILLGVFGAANAATSMPNLDLVGAAGYNDQNTARVVCLANNIVDERCLDSKYKAVSIVSKFNAKGTHGSIILIKSDNPLLEGMNFKNLQEGKALPFVKVKLATEAGKPAEFVEIVKNACFWSVDPSTSNGSGGAVCEKVGFDYHTNSAQAVLLKNPNDGGYDEKATP